MNDPRFFLLVVPTLLLVFVFLPRALLFSLKVDRRSVLVLGAAAILARLVSPHVPNNFYSDMPISGSFKLNPHYRNAFYEGAWGLWPHQWSILSANIFCGVCSVVILFGVAAKVAPIAKAAFAGALTVAVAPFFARETSGYELHPFGLLAFAVGAWSILDLLGRARGPFMAGLGVVVSSFLLAATRIELASGAAILVAVALATGFGPRAWEASGESPRTRLKWAIAGITIGVAFGRLLPPGVAGPVNSPLQVTWANIGKTIAALPEHWMATGFLIPRWVPLGSIILILWPRRLWRYALSYAALMLILAAPYTATAFAGNFAHESFNDLCMGRYALVWGIVPAFLGSFAFVTWIERFSRGIRAALWIALYVPTIPLFATLYPFQAEFVFLRDHAELLRGKCLVVGWQKNGGGGGGLDLTDSIAFPSFYFDDALRPDQVITLTVPGQSPTDSQLGRCEGFVYFSNAIAQVDISLEERERQLDAATRNALVAFAAARRHFVHDDNVVAQQSFDTRENGFHFSPRGHVVLGLYSVTRAQLDMAMSANGTLEATKPMN